jgi:hypothetical protein
MNLPWAERELDERLAVVIELTGSLDAVRDCLTVDERLDRALKRLRAARAKVLDHDARYIARHEARSARLRDVAARAVEDDA